MDSPSDTGLSDQWMIHDWGLVKGDCAYSTNGPTDGSQAVNRGSIIHMFPQSSTLDLGGLCFGVYFDLVKVFG